MGELDDRLATHVQRLPLGDDPLKRGWAEQVAQVDEAQAELGLPPSSYVRVPYPSLDKAWRGMPPGSVVFVCGFSGNGKTAFLMSTADAWVSRGLTVYYMGLESRPKILRTHLACLRLEINPADVLSGDAKLWPQWQDTRAKITAELERQTEQGHGHGNRFVIDSRPDIGATELREALEQAAEIKADVVVIDHIDHVRLDGASNAWLESRIMVKLLDDRVKDLGLRALVATQLKPPQAHGNPLALYSAPRPEDVYMGGHKRHVATAMFGLYRPIKPGITPADIKAVKFSDADPKNLLEPDTMGVVTMKHRLGGKEGERVKLSVVRGRVMDQDERHKYATSYSSSGPRV